MDKLDERFSEEKFRFYLDIPFIRPQFIVGNTVAIRSKGITDFQMRYYRRIYQARMVEQRPEPVYEEETDNVVEESEAVVVSDAVGVVAVESVDITDKREALSVADEVPERDIVLPVRDYDDDLSDVSVPVIDESMIEISKVTECGKEKPLGEKLISYE